MIYFGILIGLFFFWQKQELDHATQYRVEISRYCIDIKSKLKEDGQIRTLPLQKEIYKSLKKVTYLPKKEQERGESTKTILKFYKPKNGWQMEVVPVEKNGSILGYIRFDYARLQKNSSFLQKAMFAVTLLYVSACFVFYKITKCMIRPFQKLSEIPYELAKGNLNFHIEESKNRYFGRFLWGIEMLRDTIALQKEKELRLEKEKKMILLTISHDIKTPLNAINLYAKAFEKDFYQTKEERSIAAKRIQDKVKEMDAFIVEIIRTSSEDILNIEVSTLDFYVKDFIEKVKRTYMDKCRLKQVDFQMETLDNLLLHADIDRLYEAFGNIMENAYKYGDGRRIDVFFTKEEQFLLIHIFNTGTPLPESELSHIFESFFRGSNIKENQGNGLGLYICNEIMRKMMGDIYVKGKEEGMEFVLVVPIA